MLRIKEGEWQRFCDNAEKLGLKKKIKYYSDNRVSISIETHFCLVNNIVYSPYGEFVANENMCNSQRLFIGNVLYDLIQQGYVEKVEEK